MLRDVFIACVHGCLVACASSRTPTPPLAGATVLGLTVALLVLSSEYVIIDILLNDVSVLKEGAIPVTTYCNLALRRALWLPRRAFCV